MAAVVLVCNTAPSTDITLEIIVKHRKVCNDVKVQEYITKRQLHMNIC